MKTNRPIAWILTACLLAIFPANILYAQMTQQPSRLSMMNDQQTVTGGLGMTMIDGKPYYLFHLMPELSFGKIGIGLDVNIRIGEDGKVRHEDFKDAYSYLRLIRYVRYGAKHEPWYARLGTLDYSNIGHGYIMYMYRNSASYDLRKIGVEFDADMKQVGFESMYSDIGGAGVLGLRGYARPLQFTDAGAIPILGGLETGITFASDFNANANQTRGEGDVVGQVKRAQKGGALSIMGFDLGLPLLTHEMIRSTLYADYAKILNYGSGTTLGLNLQLRGIGIITVDAKYERRFVGDQFLPSYFNALYERERYEVQDTLFKSKAQNLRNAVGYGGYFGELVVRVLNTFDIVGGYQAPLGRKNEGTFHMELLTSDALPGILISGGYDKKNVGSIFKLDNNSLLYAQVGYKPAPYIVVSMLYEWTFAEVRNDATGEVVGFKAQKRIEPRVGFIVHF